MTVRMVVMMRVKILLAILLMITTMIFGGAMMMIIGGAMMMIIDGTMMMIIGATMMMIIGALITITIGATMMMIIGVSGGGPWQRPIGATEVPLLPHNRRVRGERNFSESSSASNSDDFPFLDPLLLLSPCCHIIDK